MSYISYSELVSGFKGQTQKMRIEILKEILKKYIENMFQRSNSENED